MRDRAGSDETDQLRESGLYRSCGRVWDHLRRFLDRVDLIVHEAGHLFFSWFGEFVQVMGGTIGQLLVPLGIAGYFFFRKEQFSFSIVLFWIGQNLFNISVYIKDAQAMALPLVSVGGGEDSIHDWNYMLSNLGLLHYDQAVGILAYLLGCAIIIASVLCCGYLSLQDEQSASD
jgi:hypothetical protein